MVAEKKNDRWIDCRWCGSVTRTFWEGSGDELCLACKRVVNGKRNDTRTPGDVEDTDELKSDT